MAKRRIWVRFKNLPIASSMMVSFGAIIIAIIVLISVVFYIDAVRTSESTAYESNVKLLSEAVKRVDDLHNVITQISFYVASDPSLRRLLKEFPDDPVERIEYQNQICRFLTQFWLNRSEVVGISIYFDKAQGVSRDTIGVSSTQFARERGWLDLLGNRRGVIINGNSSVLRGSIPIASLSLVKILDFNEALLGYISFEISSKDLYAQCFASNKATAGSILFAVDKNWKIISHTDPKMINTDISASYPAFAQDKRLVNVNGKRMVQVVGDPNNVKWRAVEFIPLREVFDSGRLAVALAVLGICGVCIALALVWILSSRITRPIVELSSIMSEEKPLEAVLPTSYTAQTNEIGHLFGSYSAMILRQNQLIRQLEELKEEEKTAELNALRSQMNPHFMYNTLDYINWMAQDSDVPEISKMLTLLSRFLRISLSSATMKCILKSEIEHVTAYLDIFNARYGNRFSYSISADEDIQSCLVPQFILQPLVENSIIHGFGRNVADSFIEVRIHRREEWVTFDVFDNGVGMSEGRLKGLLDGTVEPSRNGYGMKNVDDRIRSIYGSGGYSGFSLIPRPKGTCIHFEIKASFEPAREERDVGYDNAAHC